MDKETILQLLNQDYDSWEDAKEDLEKHFKTMTCPYCGEVEDLKYFKKVYNTEHELFKICYMCHDKIGTSEETLRNKSADTAGWFLSHMLGEEEIPDSEHGYCIRTKYKDGKIQFYEVDKEGYGEFILQALQWKTLSFKLGILEETIIPNLLKEKKVRYIIELNLTSCDVRSYDEVKYFHVPKEYEKPMQAVLDKINGMKDNDWESVWDQSQ